MARRRPSRRKPRRDRSSGDRTLRAAAAGLVFFSTVVLVANAFLGDKSLLELHRLAERREWWTRENARLRRENLALAARLRDAETDPFLVEKIAREDLGMARPDEIVYLFDRPRVDAAGESGGTP